ncbi:hypothetical protein E4U42_005598 [Claviceps africana]|uniref:Acyl-CoA oxidase/dehydrogenase middle domain-containing protein n=1 Tax=Claviceps africana TaxID=83212 RepID=A0A8K0J5N4_9HYPO|nr:hypothetical protein E4U42_005598 [Claviceps africana]
MTISRPVPSRSPLSLHTATCKSGIPFIDVPAPYRQVDVPDQAGIPHAHLDAFHFLLISKRDVSRGRRRRDRIGGCFGHRGCRACFRDGRVSRWESRNPVVGSDVARIRISADKTADGRSYIVNGVKKWITGTPWATHMTTAVGCNRKARSCLAMSFQYAMERGDLWQTAGSEPGHSEEAVRPGA